MRSQGSIRQGPEFTAQGDAGGGTQLPDVAGVGTKEGRLPEGVNGTLSDRPGQRLGGRAQQSSLLQGWPPVGDMSRGATHQSTSVEVKPPCGTLASIRAHRHLGDPVQRLARLQRDLDYRGQQPFSGTGRVGEGSRRQVAKSG